MLKMHYERSIIIEEKDKLRRMVPTVQTNDYALVYTFDPSLVNVVVRIPFDYAMAVFRDGDMLIVAEKVNPKYHDMDWYKKCGQLYKRSRSGRFYVTQCIKQLEIYLPLGLK